MNTRILFTRWSLMAVVMAFLTVSCTDEEPIGEFAFTSRIEGLVDTDTTGAAAAGTKVFLENEKWLYWEDGDIISIGSDASEGSYNCYMAQLAHVNAGFIHDPDSDWQQFNGVFITSLPRTSKYFLGLHPFNANNVIHPETDPQKPTEFEEVKIVCPDVQPFTGNDLSFARNVIPMVAWYGGEWRPEQPSVPFNLDFHALAGIVRLQFFPQNEMTIYRISVSSNRALSGTFDVNEYNTAAPYLTASNAGNRVYIDCGSEGRTFRPGEIISFYLVVPVQSRGREMHNMEISFSVTPPDPNGNYAYSDPVPLTVPVRRCGISFVPALEVRNADVTNYGLAGNGTEERPYKIYTIRDLVYLRDCFIADTANPVVNGVHVTANTVFHLMRNDIMLADKHPNSVLNGVNYDWHVGIPNFKGKFVWRAYGGNSTPGIINVSHAPLFSSISANGRVIDLPVRASVNYNEEAPDSQGGTVVGSTVNFSPFCFINKGTISNCRVYDYDTNYGSDITTHKARKAGSNTGIRGTSASLGGIAVYNFKDINDCSCELTFSTSVSSSVAGIALFNGTENDYSAASILRCAAATPMRIYAAGNGSGIADVNRGTITDSYFTIRQTDTNSVSWSGIAAENVGTIKHCYMSPTAAVVTSASAAGIVGQNLDGGLVDNCWFGGSITASQVGAGIAHTNIRATIINCYVNGAQLISPPGNNSVVGGLVAYMGEDVLADNYIPSVLANSYFYAPRILHQNAANEHKVGALVAYALYGGIIDNCYAYETGNPINKFYYENIGTDITNCFHVGHSSYSTEPGIAVVSTTNAHNMYSSLQSHKDGHGTGVSWVPGNPPVLEVTPGFPTKSAQRSNGFGRLARR